jgi:DNA-binding MarR family transcriptional regulator
VTAAPPDLETRLAESDHESLRLWLRLFTCVQLLERRVRGQLRRRFGTTLARFDLMAQLDRHREGLRMGELSQRLMVTGANITGLTDQLAAEGLVERKPLPGDRRAALVRLTPAGRKTFDRMARVHEGWIVDLLAGLTPDERTRLHELLGKVKQHVQAHHTLEEE